MKSHASMRLGKLAARHDNRTLLFAKYASPTLPLPPPAKDWGSKVKSWPMYANDRIGDCTCAAAGHMVEAWTSQAKKAIAVPTDKEVLAAYEQVSGYNPRTGANDNGAVELDVLKYWRKTGIGSHKLGAFVYVEPKNHLHVKQSVMLFGGIYIGLTLPVSAQDQDVWTVPAGGTNGPGAPGSWGGHAVNVVAYDDHGITVITWGAKKRMTWAFWDAYCEEAYALLSRDFINAKGAAPSGFNLAQLKKDLGLL